MHMVTISHQGTEPNDVIRVESESMKDALDKLLELRGVSSIASLEPAVIDTKWC